MWARVRTAAVMFALAGAGPAIAADTTPPDPDAMTFTEWSGTTGQMFGQGTRTYIFADGDITADTAKAFQDFLKAHPPKGMDTTVVLNSPGGDLGGGLDLGQAIRDAKLWTEVGSQFPVNIAVSPNIPAAMVPFLARPATPPFPGGCYSACTFAFLGGLFRSVPYASVYGVHRFDITGTDQAPNPLDLAQQLSGILVKYVNDMGVAPEFITEMSQKGPNDINDLSAQRMAQLKIITPRWQSSWQIAPLGDYSGFYLQGISTDQWGTHEIAVQCASPVAASATPSAPAPSAPFPSAPAPSAPSPSAPPSQSTGAGQPAPSTGAAAKHPTGPRAQLAFSLDPGPRGDAATLANAVAGYALELDQGTVSPPSTVIAEKAAADGNRLVVRINAPASLMKAMQESAHIGFAFMFDPQAKLPMRLLQFEADISQSQLKSYLATCR
ncbi:MAG: hypothetical protein JO267_11340 [Alphaproteobacteria bacterium]|nr:hypothetical protein [Alphaproteobacteria bacterium]MBV9862729.1 hypothetical protein [Alphaproteobacteria bacterium]